MRYFAHCWMGKLKTIEDSSLVILGCQLLPLATSKVMGDNKEFYDSPYFEVFYSLLEEKASEH